MLSQRVHPGRLSETQRGDNEIRFCRRIGTYWLPCRLQFRKRTRSRYENDANDQNSRHRDHQSRFNEFSPPTLMLRRHDAHVEGSTRRSKSSSLAMFAAMRWALAADLEMSPA